MITDTIAAISTALSDSGIGIIRVSGSEALSSVNRIFVNAKYERKLLGYKTHTIHYGYIVDYDYICKYDDLHVNIDFSEGKLSEDVRNHILDEVMVSVMKGPHSFTKEDVVEINCHGGVMMVKKILENVIKTGVRVAEPGEFTKRAFLNGRIDLSEAEAVMDIIHSKSEFALKNSVKQLKGSLSQKIKELRSKMIYEIAYIESALDDPEHYDLTEYPEELRKKILLIQDDIAKLIDSFENGKVWSEGINTVIVGKPNAGKSSLLNAIVGTDRAIVTDIPGTTRDTIEENVMFQGINLHMIDTAGIRNTEDTVEKIGVQKSIDRIEDADLVLYVVDSSVPLSEEDMDIMNLVKNRKCIVLLNKNDLEQIVSENVIREMFSSIDANAFENVHIISSSTMKENGMVAFSKLLSDLFINGYVKMNDEVVITNIRHKEALIASEESLQKVLESIDMCMPEDFFSIDLMSAYSSLGYIIGEEVGDDLVQEIFTKFCMGK